MFFWKKKPTKSLKDIDFDKDNIHGEVSSDTVTDSNASDDESEVIPKYKEEKTNSIYIDVGYSTFSWMYTPYNPKEDEEIDEVWSDFLNWFNHKKDEPYYVMCTATSQRMFARKDIRGYSIEVTTKKIPEGEDV